MICGTGKCGHHQTHRAPNMKQHLELPVENVKFEFRINRLVILALYSTFTNSGLEDTLPSRLEKPGIEQRTSQLVGDPLHLLSRIHSESSKIRNISQTVGRGWNEAVRHAEWWAFCGPLPEFCSSSAADLHQQQLSKSLTVSSGFSEDSYTSFTSRRHRLEKRLKTRGNRGRKLLSGFLFLFKPTQRFTCLSFIYLIYFVFVWSRLWAWCVFNLPQRPDSALSQVQVPVGGLGLRVIHPHKQTVQHRGINGWTSGDKTGPLTIGWIQKTVSDRRSDVRKKKADRSAELRRRFFRDVIRGKKLSAEESAPAIVTAGVLKLGAHREMQACLGFPD